LKLGRVEAERVEEMLGVVRLESGEGCMVVERGRRVVRLRGFSIAYVGTVDLKLDVTTREPDRRIPASREELDGVVVVELLDGRGRRDRLLRLSDQHVMRSRGDRGAFVGIQIDELRVHFKVRLRNRTPRDAKLDVVVLERHERKSGLSILTEREAERVELSGVRAVTERGERLGIRLRE